MKTVKLPPLKATQLIWENSANCNQISHSDVFKGLSKNLERKLSAQWKPIARQCSSKGFVKLSRWDNDKNGKVINQVYCDVLLFENQKTFDLIWFHVDKKSAFEYKGVLYT